MSSNIKYLKVTGRDICWAKNEITKHDLLEVRNGVVDMIIDLETKSFYDASENEWKPIQGET